MHRYDDWTDIICVGVDWRGEIGVSLIGVGCVCVVDVVVRSCSVKLFYLELV